MCAQANLVLEGVIIDHSFKTMSWIVGRIGCFVPLIAVLMMSKPPNFKLQGSVLVKKSNSVVCLGSPYG